MTERTLRLVVTELGEPRCPCGSPIQRTYRGILTCKATLDHYAVAYGRDLRLPLPKPERQE